MKNKLILIPLITACILAASIIFIITFNYSHTKTKNTSTEKGEITITESSVIYDEYESLESELFFPAKSHVNITNVELLYDLLTLEALKSLLPEVSDFLDKHGYSDVTTLSILPETIIQDRGYPFFQLTIEGKEDIIIAIRYHLETYEYEIELQEK